MSHHERQDFGNEKPFKKASLFYSVAVDIIGAPMPDCMSTIF
jgi:hypothetical protein